MLKLLYGWVSQLIKNKKIVFQKIVLMVSTQAKHHKWEKVFKNGPSKICGRQPLKNLKEYGLL